MDTNPVTPTGEPVVTPPTPETPVTPPVTVQTPPPAMDMVQSHGSSWFNSLPQRTTLFIGALALLTVLLLYLAITQYPATPKKTVAPAVPTPTPVAQTVLSLDLQPATSSSRLRTVNVHIDSGNNEVTAVQLELSFDPNAFTSVTATQASFFADPSVLFKDTNMKTGNLTYALGIAPGQTPVKGSGTVITLQFLPSATTSASTVVKILPKTLVTAKGAVQSVLKSENEITIPLATITTMPAVVPSTKPSTSTPSAGY